MIRVGAIEVIAIVQCTSMLQDLFALMRVRRALGGFRKRAVDIALTGIALIVLTPILLATAGLVRLLQAWCRRATEPPQQCSRNV
jgi:lipopolysaccharide/colanic/teichoic acid biosynthesis glycosyltransferase